VSSKIGDFAKPGAPDFCPAKQALLPSDRACFAGRKYGDAGFGKSPIFEGSCVKIESYGD